MEKWQIVQSIYRKLLAKCPIDKLNNIKSKKIASTNPLRICITRDTTSSPGRNNHNGGSGGTGYRIVSKNYATAQLTRAAGGISFLNFNSELERKNAWQSYLTKFARFCIAMDESTKLAPYMDDYSEPWTDERFVEFFGLTEDEWKVIDETIK